MADESITAFHLFTFIMESSNPLIDLHEWIGWVLSGCVCVCVTWYKLLLLEEKGGGGAGSPPPLESTSFKCDPFIGQNNKSKTCLLLFLFFFTVS